MTSGNQKRWFASKAASTTGRGASGRPGRGRRPISRLRGALTAIALLGAALVPLALAATVAPASADTFTAQPVPGTIWLAAVTCPTATTCLAVGSGTGPTGNTGVVVPITNGVPGAPQLVPGTFGLTGVACSGPTTCVAVGTMGIGLSQRAVVVPIVGGVVGTVQVIPTSGARLSGVACYNATSCVAVGLVYPQGLVVPITNGVAGTPQLIANVQTGLTGVSCYNATACIAVGSNRVFPQPPVGVQVLITNGTGGAAQAVPGTTNLTAIACRVSVCEATGGLSSGQPGVVPFVDGVPGTPQSASASINSLVGIACPTDTLCEAVGNVPGGNTGIGAVVPVLSGTPADPQLVPGSDQLLGIACPTATTCVAVGTNTQVPQGVVVTPKARPTITTQASPGNLLGAPVSDSATLSGATNPTGNVTFRLFSDATCATQVFTSTDNLSGVSATSDSFTPAATGTYYWTAAYSGDAGNVAATSPCGAANESVVIAPFGAPTPTRTITGNFLGPLTVNAGDSVLLTNARVVGRVTVNAGGALTVVNSRISRGIVANGPRFFSVCGSQISGPVVVANAAVPIRIGDPATGCASNRLAGNVILTLNTAGLTLGANIVSGNVAVTNNTVGTDVVKANNISKALACTGNSPPPTNAGQTNTAASKFGQCSSL